MSTTWYVVKDLGERLLDVLWPRRRQLAELRARWARPGTRHERLASRYFELTRERLADACVDDKTWADLEFPQLFTEMDTTVTPLGSQVLFRRLREYVRDPGELAARHALYGQLRTDAALRERLQLGLTPLQDDSHAYLAGFLFGPAPAPLPHRGLLALWGLASVAVLAATIAWSWPVWIWLAMVLANGVIIYRTYWRALRDMTTLKDGLQMVAVADRLGALHARHPSVPPLARLHGEKARRAGVRRSLWLLALLKQPVVVYLAWWLNLAFLLELVVHAWSVERFVRLRDRLAPTFELLGELDAAIAVASFLASRPAHCRPAIATGPRLEIEEGCHPLLADGVPNTLRLDRRSALVTGSNMAGKTTFVKMLGMNTILGRTLGFCLASRAVLPPLPVMASIHGVHSVASGKSHYFAEIEAIRAFLDREGWAGGGLFVIDEPFSGTNTVERVAIARAVLAALGEHSLVLVTTHDVELQAMLRERYALYHFQEDPDVDGFFDYRLRPGPATARNAIRLLARMDFPEDVVADAMTHAGQERPARTQERGRGSGPSSGGEPAA